MTYYPDPVAYQQLHNGDPHGNVNCTAWSAAYLVDAHTAGHTRTTGTKVRAATDEPRPDPGSPGLTLPQVDAAVRKLTAIDFDTRLSDTIVDAEARIIAGRYAEIQVIRGILVDHGYGTGFRGGHAIVVRTPPGDPTPVIFDPLERFTMRASWGPIWQAAAAISGPGRVNAMFSRDLVADYAVTITLAPHAKMREYHTFVVKAGRIVRRETRATHGFTATCTPPRFHPWKGHVGRSLVQVTSGAHKGLYVRSFFAHEVP